MEALTLASAKDSALPGAVGLCPDDPRFTRLLNQARNRLMNHGRWWGMVARLRFCLDGNLVTWPGIVAHPERLVVCGHSVQVQNAWYEYLYPERLFVCP